MPCPNKDLCGSCGWSHIPYEKQLEQKLGDINGSFALKKLDIRCEEIIPSPILDHYRNRMDFVIDFQGKVGLREKGKWWRVIDNHPCFIADEKIEQLFYSCRQLIQQSGFTYYDRKANTGLLRYAVIRSTTLGETMVNFVTSAPIDNEKDSFVAWLRTLHETVKPTTTIWTINNTVTDVSFGDEIHVICGPGFIEERINAFTYRISPQSFFQTNPHGAGILQKTVIEFAEGINAKTVLDLYCGSGFFTLPFATSANRTIGVELNSEAIKEARENAKINDLQVEFFDLKSEDYDWKGLNPDLVITDPPRSGMHDKALKDLLSNAPKTIIYVSCNYKQLARESVEILKRYELNKLRAIDMFPHTPHVETVALFVRKD